MFLAYCTECGLRELRGARSLAILAPTGLAPIGPAPTGPAPTGLASTGHGVAAVYRCRQCDAVNVLHPEPAAPAAAAPAAGPAAA